MAFDLNKEISEAICAGEAALRSLNDAQNQLNKAKGWGVVDILGGGLLTDLIKHSKIDNAKQCMNDAKRKLAKFRKELDDIDDYIPNLDVGSFYTFADFFFDGLLADILMQSKISEACRQVDDAIYRVNTILERLRMEEENW